MIDETEQSILKASHELDLTRIKIHFMKQKALKLEMQYRHQDGQLRDLISESSFRGVLKWRRRQIREEEEYVVVLKAGIEDLRNGLRILRG